ncbi:unnamed protein product [Musa acuminata subsp. burmannicoides]
MLLLVALSTSSIERRGRPDYEQQCAAVSSSNPDKELRRRLSDSEHKLGLSMPIEEAKERAAQLQSEVTSLERHMILASGIQGMEGFHQHWSLHGHLDYTERRLEALNQGRIEKRKADMIQGEPKRDPVRKKWVFFW